MNAVQSCENWPALLEACVATCHNFHHVTVLRETASTQDAAVFLGAKHGHVVTALRQTAGRGRLGRAWADTGEEGVAITFVTSAAPPERLALLSAVAAARAAEQCLASIAAAPPVGIRWPNDIVSAGRKLAGILVEQDQHTARIGLGMNVAQRSFPAELETIACSLAQLGAIAERVEVVAAIISCIDTAMDEPDDALRHECRTRDVLRGRTATFAHDRKTVTGRVLEVDPARGLRVLTDAGEVFLPAATTSLVSVETGSM